MKTKVDERMLREARDFGFRFACDDCAHFDAPRSQCSFGFDAAPRREALSQPHLQLCKAFELG